MWQRIQLSQEELREASRPGSESKKPDRNAGRVFVFGGAKRDRTADLYNAIVMDAIFDEGSPELPELDIWLVSWGLMPYLIVAVVTQLYRELTECGSLTVPPEKKMPKLTKRLIDAARVDPGDAEVFLWDTDVKGFGVRVKPSRLVDGETVPGAKSFVLKYRVATQTRRYTISKVGSPYTVEQARDLAGDLLRGIRDGHDPMSAKSAEREAMTVSELAALYLKEGPAEKPNKKASSWGADSSNINRHILPLLGRKVAKSLKQSDIAKFQADVADGKTAADIKTGHQGRAIVEGGKGTAARSLAVLGAMLQFGVGRGVLPVNPAKGVKLFQGEKKERFLSDAEVALLADTLIAMESEGLNRNAAAAIRLLMLTGCRKDEILSLRWEHVDFERKCLRLPDSKTGAKVVPIASAAMELLARLPRNGKAAWVLPASNRLVGKKAAQGHYTGLQKAWEKVRERAAIEAARLDPDAPAGQLVTRLTKKGVLPSYAECVKAAAADGWQFPVGLANLRLHDMRHSFASFAIADGATLYMVSKVLGHKQTRTTEGYAHLADDPVRAVADRAANRISAAMKRPDGGGDIVEFPKRKA